MEPSRGKEGSLSRSISGNLNASPLSLLHIPCAERTLAYSSKVEGTSLVEISLRNSSSSPAAPPRGVGVSLRGTLVLEGFVAPTEEVMPFPMLGLRGHKGKLSRECNRKGFDLSPHWEGRVF